MTNSNSLFALSENQFNDLNSKRCKVKKHERSEQGSNLECNVSELSVIPFDNEVTKKELMEGFENGSLMLMKSTEDGRTVYVVSEDEAGCFEYKGICRSVDFTPRSLPEAADLPESAEVNNSKDLGVNLVKSDIQYSHMHPMFHECRSETYYWTTPKDYMQYIHVEESMSTGGLYTLYPISEESFKEVDEARRNINKSELVYDANSVKRIELNSVNTYDSFEYYEFKNNACVKVGKLNSSGEFVEVGFLITEPTHIVNALISKA